MIGIIKQHGEKGGPYEWKVPYLPIGNNKVQQAGFPNSGSGISIGNWGSGSSRAPAGVNWRMDGIRMKGVPWGFSMSTIMENSCNINVYG